MLLKINVIGSIVTHILKDFKWEKWYIIQILILSILPLFWKHYVSFFYHFLSQWKTPSISFRALWPFTDFKLSCIWKCLCFTLISQNVFLPYTKLWIDSFFVTLKNIVQLSFCFLWIIIFLYVICNFLFPWRLSVSFYL